MASAFIGRASESAALTTALAAAVAGRGGVVLIAGEPGIGKTRLADELLGRARDQGAHAVRARAAEDAGAPPYWLFRRLIRTLADARPPSAELRGQLATVAPELGDTRGGTTSPDLSAERRFLLFEAVCDYFAEAAADTGLVLTFDDVQWADAPSLALLRHLAGRVAGTRLLVLAGYRDTELGGREHLSSLLAALAHEDAVSRIRLVGLSPAEVADQLAVLRGGRVPADLAAAVSRRSQGNPFFVAELGRLLPGPGQDTDGDAAAAVLPDAVRDAVRGRLNRCSQPCRTLVSRAAVLGASGDVAGLAVAADQDPLTVAAAVDEAVRAGLLASDGRWRFVHDLVRETARLELPGPERLAVHERVARHLAAVGAEAAEIAHHAVEALPLGDPDLAVEWSERAAADALRVFAWEEGVMHFDRALAIGIQAPPVRARLLTGRARAQVAGLDIPAARESILAAVDAARAAGDAAAIGTAALALEGHTDWEWIATGKQLCAEALAGLPDEDSPLRARLLARMAAECTYYGEPEMAGYSAAALAMADRVDDPHALRSALRARQMACAGPDGVRERVLLADRMLGLDQDGGDPDAVFWGRLWRFDALVQLGRIEEAGHEVTLLAPVVDRLGSAIARWHLLRSRGALAIARGRFDEAVQLTQQVIELSGNDQMRATTVSTLLQLSGLTGRRELLTPWLPLLHRAPAFATAMLSLWHVMLGEMEEARQYYRPAEVLADRVANRFLVTVGNLAEQSFAWDDRETAATTYELLLPYADLFQSGGAGVIATGGSVRRYLGLAATTAGHHDDAVRHLRLAIEANEAARLAPFAAQSRYALAVALDRRRRPGDRDEARAQVVAARAAAVRLGMEPLVRTLTRLADGWAGTRPAGLTPREREIAELVAQGMTNRQIAAVAHISERTAENHVRHILAELGFATRTQIATWVTGQRAAD